MAQIEVTTGPELQRVREARGITQAQLADAMRTAQTYVSKIETRHIVKPKTVDRYMQALEALTGGNAA